MKPASPSPGTPARRRLALVPPASDPPPAPPHQPLATADPAVTLPAPPAPATADPGTAQAPAPAPAPDTPPGDPVSELWAAHGRSLLRFATKLTLGDQHRAEDIVQETLLRAWRHPKIITAGPPGHTRLRPWLFTIARHIAIDMWRARTRDTANTGASLPRTASSTTSNGDTGYTDLPDLPDPADHIESAITAIDVRAALATLSPAHQDVITELYFHGHSVAETGAILGIPPGTVKSRAHYASHALRHALTRSACTTRNDRSQRRLSA